MDGMEEAEIKKVIEHCERLEFLALKYFKRMAQKDGLNVTISVMGNISTTLLGNVFAIIDAEEGNVDQMIGIFIHEMMSKFKEGSAEVKANKMINQFTLAGLQKNNKPMH